MQNRLFKKKKLLQIQGALILVLLIFSISSAHSSETYSKTVTTPANSKYNVKLIIDETFHKGENYWVKASVNSISFGKNVTAIYEGSISINIFKQKPANPTELDEKNYITGGLGHLFLNRIDILPGTALNVSKDVIVDVSMLNSTQKYFANVIFSIHERRNDTNEVDFDDLLVWQGWISGEDYSESNSENAAFSILMVFPGIIILPILKNYKKVKFT